MLSTAHRPTPWSVEVRKGRQERSVRRELCVCLCVSVALEFQRKMDCLSVCTRQRKRCAAEALRAASGLQKSVPIFVMTALFGISPGIR